MADIPEGSVVITPAEVYSRVVTLTESVTRMLEADKHEADARARLDDRVTKVEAEVGSLKQKLWFVAGLASAGGAGLGSIVAPLLVR